MHQGMRYAINSATGQIHDAHNNFQPAENVDKLGVWKALREPGEALIRAGIGTDDGPLPVVIAISGPDFQRLEKAMQDADAFSAQFFAPLDCGGHDRPRNRAMIAGIDIIAADQ